LQETREIKREIHEPFVFKNAVKFVSRPTKASQTVKLSFKTLQLNENRNKIAQANKKSIVSEIICLETIAIRSTARNTRKKPNKRSQQPFTVSGRDWALRDFFRVQIGRQKKV
jgi:hypothetical protein